MSDCGCSATGLCETCAETLLDQPPEVALAITGGGRVWRRPPVPDDAAVRFSPTPGGPATWWLHTIKKHSD